MPLFCLGLNHRTAPLAAREQLTYAPAALEAALARFCPGRSPNRRELVILSTCNRTEVYAYDPAFEGSGESGDPFDALFEVLVEARGVSAVTVASYLYRLAGAEAVQHLCRVAAGLESMVVGEPQILGQVSGALKAALRHQTAGAVMTALFRTAIRAGRRARHETNINRKRVSIPSVAAQVAERVAGTLDQRRVVVVGAGAVGAQMLRALRERGAGEVALVNRTWERAERVARQGKATPYRLEQLTDVLADADLVITSTAAPAPILSVEAVQTALRKRAGRVLTLIDLAVPRNVDPAVRFLEHARLLDLDDLHAHVQAAMAERRREIPRVEEIVREEARAFQQWGRSADVMPLIADLRHKAEFIRRQELNRTLRHLPDLDAQTRKHLEHLSYALVNKLLHEPTTRLRMAAQAGRAAESAETVRHLFALATNEVHAA